MSDFDPSRIPVIDLRGPHRPGRSRGPLAVVCGLPILVRNLLVLERAGFRQTLILVDPSDALAVKQATDRHPRLRIEIAWVEDTGDALAPVLAAAGTKGAEVLYWPGETSCGRLAPAIASAPVRTGSMVIEDADSRQMGLALLLIGTAALSAGGQLSAMQLAEQLSRDGRVERLAPSGPLIAIESRDDLSRAEAALLQSLRKKEDGALAKYDRAISLAISSLVMRLPVHPNYATVVAGLIGWMSGVIASHGGYGWLLAGAIVYYASNIVDGIDGELARAKLLESRLGQWLDTLFDDSTNLAFWLGTAIGSYRTWHSSTSLALGLAIAVGIVIVAAVMYHYLVTVAHSGDLNAMVWPWESGEPDTASGVLGRVKFLLRRDTVSGVSVVAAALGQSRVMLWLAAAGVSVLWIIWSAYTLAGPRSRPGA
jgi:phosphatidylglycerophosphate synthase